ncbi:MAG: recombination mediator RecR [Vicinamibacteria bacterium]|jgi:recombination protein RecR|nr:recombination mediator RecR [Vicinamibacteria bacterium]
MVSPAPVARLIDELRHLPGIGPKSAQRICFHLLRGQRAEAARLAAAINEMMDLVRTCERCNAFSEQAVCAICDDASRSERTLCVIEQPHNLLAIEKALGFKGRYHVLHGALQPLAGIGPDELRIAGLIERVRTGGVEEIILATSPTTEGEATAVYLAKLLKPLGVRVTRIAMGLPVGTELEWADEVTMAKAIEGRREY